jgi:hypothetical protein
VRNMAAEFCLQIIFFHARKVLLHAVNLRHGTDDFTYPPKKVVLQIFITLKNPSFSAGFEPANLGSSGKHATTRPPRAPTDNISGRFLANRQTVQTDIGGRNNSFIGSVTVKGINYNI